MTDSEITKLKRLIWFNIDLKFFLHFILNDEEFQKSLLCARQGKDLKMAEIQ